MPKTRSKPENLLNKIITKMTREKALTAFSTARKNLYPSYFKLRSLFQKYKCDELLLMAVYIDQYRYASMGFAPG